MNINPNEPYNELPSLPPKGDIETKNILKASISANKALQKCSVERLLNNKAGIRTLRGTSLKNAVICGSNLKTLLERLERLL